MDSERNRYSYFCAEPIDIFEFNCGDEEPFEKLKSILNKYHLYDRDCRDPLLESCNDNHSNVFTGGWVGFFSYDLNRYIEDIPSVKKDDIALPLIRLCFYDKIICFDHLEKCYYLFALEFDGDGAEKIKQLENSLVFAANGKLTPSMKLRANKNFQSNMTQQDYFDAIAKTKKHIYDGDVYQINLSQRFTADYNCQAHKLFLWQNQFNPSPYSAYIDAEDYQIVSASPELFINIKDGIITTCPIKGTRARTGDEVLDKRNYQELLENEKEKAELDMIIDLERNDLGRICKYGTTKVEKRREIEKFSTVFHAVSTINGELKKGMDFTQCLMAMFPGGSITGAPKISAMKLINAVEPSARGLYTGSIGWIDLCGNACLNIVIRTIIIKAGKAYAQTGGGIVADSDARAEWDETLVKAKALLAGIKAVNLPQRKE